MSKATRSLTIGQNVRVTEPTAPTEFEVQAYFLPCNWRKNAKHPVDFAREEGRLL